MMRFAVPIPVDADFKDCIRLIMEVSKLSKSKRKGAVVIRNMHYSDERAYVTRQEVYATIEKYARPEMTSQIKEQLDARYPIKDWKNYFPFAGAFQTIINDNLESLVI